MTVESKFDLGQRIFWLENNKVQHAIVKSIQFPRIYGDKSIAPGKCMYFVSRNKRSREINWNGGGLYESQCFGSKKDLLKSL